MSRTIPVVALLLGTLAAGRPASGAVVGTGSAGSCTETALDGALAAGGNVTFNCGSGNVTITLTTPKTITGTVTLDGGRKITLSGGNALRPFAVEAGGHLTLTNVTLQNGGSTGDGGCVANAGGTLTLTDMIVQDCSATGDGGAVANAAGGTLGITIVTMRRNTAGGGGGAVHNAGTLTVDDLLATGNSAARGGALHNTGTATLQSAAFRTNTVTVEGGGVHNAAGGTLHLNGGFLGSELATNVAASTGTTTGGGLRNDGTATLDTVWIKANSATNGGGVANGTTGTLTLTAVAVTANTAATGAGGGLDNSGSATLTNCTFSGNQATAGGGLVARNGAASLAHVTLCDDTGGAIARLGGTVTLGSSAVAPASGTACAGSVASDGHNVAADATCALAQPSDQTADPSLAPLAFVGVGVQTPVCLPQAGSPVVDAATGPNCPAKDQRGFTRPFGPACDVGAVEVSASDPTVTTTTTTTTTTTSSTLPGGGTTSTTTTSTFPGGSTTSSTLPTGATTTTTVSPGSSTTTTLPGGERCAGVPRAATFVSADCRFEVLSAAMNALDGVTPRAPKLRDRLSRAASSFQQARASCLGSDPKAAVKQLKSAFRSLSSLRKLLGSKVSKTVPDRDLLLSVVDGLRQDVQTLRRALSCPTDAASPA